MTAKVFVNGRFTKNIEVSPHIFATFPKSFDASEILKQAQNAIGTTNGIVQAYIPVLDVLL